MSDGRGPAVLLSTPTSAALLDGRGDLELTREMRGAATEWGGAIAQCVRLSGAWRLALRCGTIDGALPSTRTGATPGNVRWASRHAWEGFAIEHTTAAVESPPGVLRTLRCVRPDGVGARITVTSTLVPFLLPVLVEGIRPTEFRVETSTDELRIRQRGFGLALRSNVAPTQLFLNRASWIGGRYQGPVEELGVEYALDVPPGGSAELRLLMFGGLERILDGAAGAAAAAVDDPGAAAARTEAADRSWIAASPTLRFPDAPELEQGYELARAALRRLFATPGDGLTGFVAGFPWYASLWGRDLAWILPAALWLGDIDGVRASLDTMFRFQGRGSVPLLGGGEGELPMQLSPGPIFLYGTADTTLHYPMLAGQWLRHAGVADLPADWPVALRRIVDWGIARSDPSTGLFRHGGEVLAIGRATSGLAAVRYGIDARDTTIWDSVDRRDHAIDVQVLWWQALRAAADLIPAADDLRSRADRLAAEIGTAYRWPDEQYLYDSLRAGLPVAHLRPNALRAVSAGLLTGPAAIALVRRAGRDDLTTPWGVRTLSARDPAYDPIAYHDGQVWTIATAWAADAALAVGEAATGLAYLRTIAARFAAEDGYANECYRGDRADPFDSCFLLGFSVAPFLTVLFERLWGLTIDARPPRIRIRPVFPSDWHSASMAGLRLGAGRVAIDWAPGRLQVVWSGPGDLTVDAPAGPVRVPAGTTADLPGGPVEQPS